MAHSHADLKTHILAQQMLIPVTSDSGESCQCTFQKCIQIPFTATGGWVKIYLPVSFPHYVPQCLNKRGYFKEEGAEESWPTAASDTPSLLAHHARAKGICFGGKARALTQLDQQWPVATLFVLVPQPILAIPLKMQPPHYFQFLLLKTSIPSTKWDKPILGDDQYEFR